MLNPNPQYGYLKRAAHPFRCKNGANHSVLLFGTNHVRNSETILPRITTTVYTVKKLSIFTSPAGMSLTKLSLAGNN